MWCKLCSLLRSSVSAIMLCSPSTTTTPTNSRSSWHSWVHGTSRYSGMSRNTRFYGTYGTNGTNGTSWSPGNPRNGRTSTTTLSSCLLALDNNYPTGWRNATSVSSSDHTVSCPMSASWLLLSTSSSSADGYACSSAGDAPSTSGSATTTLS